MNLDLSKIKNVHFVGIGGIGISAIARMMKAQGKNVSGQDIQESEIINELKKLGVNIVIGQSYKKIPTDTDLIVYTIAIENYDQDLFQKIKNSKINSLSYPEMLGFLSKDKYTIAVSGTHGKTTTTGMLVNILRDAEKDPTVIIGSLLKSPRTNFIHGNSDLFLVEACEYKRSFLQLSPNILVITNIGEDHLDYYKDIDDIKSSFRELIEKIPSDGFLVCDPDDEIIKSVITDLDINIVNYKDFYNDDLSLKVPGQHNKIDAAIAFSVASILGVSIENAKKSVQEFSGTWRRFDYKGDLLNGVKIYDDYAHHPVEIIATLQGFREIYKKEDGYDITVIFQPHLFSRTRALLEDFSKSFSLCDEVVVLPIYFAREVDDGTISSEILVEEINKHSKNAKSFDSFSKVEEYILNKVENLNDKNIIITMGAGEAFKIGGFLLNK